MITYWVPAGPEGYRHAQATEVVQVDVLCKPCGTENPPRLQRFLRAKGGGQVGVKPFVAEGQPNASGFSIRGGVLRWRLLCPHGHNTYVREEQVAAILDAVENGELPPAVSL